MNRIGIAKILLRYGANSDAQSTVRLLTDDARFTQHSTAVRFIEHRFDVSDHLKLLKTG